MFLRVTCPKTTADVRQLFGAYFTTMLDDILNAPSLADRATALSQFTREFGEVQGNPLDETPRTSAPTKIPIPTGSFVVHALEFIRHMFRHLSLWR